MYNKVIKNIQTTTLFYILIFLFLVSCMKSHEADLVVHNAVIHSMDDRQTIYEAMAIKDGKIIELGPQQQILNKYRTKKIINAEKKNIYPGLTDSHVHILLAAKQRTQIDLSECRSFDEILLKLEQYQQRNNKKVIIGHNWNEHTWLNEGIYTQNSIGLPEKKLLDQQFPQTPVCLFRYDGHTALVNTAMLNLAEINQKTVIEGGTIEQKYDQLTGILSDKVLDLIRALLPRPSKQELGDKIVEIQNEFLMYGITNIHEAGMERDDIDFFKQLIDDNRLHLNIYGMLLPTEENFSFIRRHGIYEYKNLNIRSVKVFADGSLGAWGAWLKEAYSDRSSSKGTPTITVDKFREIADFCIQHNYQLNTHAIGDAAVKMVIDNYQHSLQTNADLRWRIEHIQIIDSADLQLLSNYGIIPSVQPIHAMGDYRFAEQRLGSQRLLNSYAYRSILNATGILAIGSDFPIESNNPFLTIHAACQRKDKQNMPYQGFLLKESISLIECLSAMTNWASIASFQETRLGQLQVNMDATFVILDKKIENSETFQPNFSLYTYINGIEVYVAE